MRIGCLQPSTRMFAHLLCAVSVLATSIVAFACVAFAKTPGERHCYRGVCHRVKTIAETARLVGQTLNLTASHYDSPEKDRFNTGVFTSSGVRFDADDPTATASSNLPDGTELLVWNPANGHAAHVRVVDFGPFLADRTLDLTRAAAEELGFAQTGIAKLRVIVIAPPPHDEPKYRAGRLYRNVGGFIGVYREHELASLSSLLIVQARLRRQPSAIVQAAVNTLAPLALLDLSERATVEGPRAPFLEPNGNSDGRYVDTALTVGSPDGRYVESNSQPTASSNFNVPRRAASPEQSRDMQRVAVLGPNAGIASLRPKEKRAPVFGKARSVAPKSSTVGSDRLGDFAVHQTALANAPPLNTWHLSPPVDSRSSVLFVFGMLIMASGTIIMAYMTVPTGLANPSEFHRLPSDTYRYRRAEPARVDIVARSGCNKSRRAAPDDGRGLSCTLHSNRDEGVVRAPGGAIASEMDESNEVTHIKAGTKVKGSISDAGDIKVSGRIEGDCVCDRVTIAAGGVVTGHVIATWALIEGEVDGNVDVTDICIKSGARVKGDVLYQNIELENGAVLEAACTRVVPVTVDA